MLVLFLQSDQRASHRCRIVYRLLREERCSEQEMRPEEEAVPHKPHAVLIPLPSQGHMKTMLQLAKLLHRKGFHITYVNLEINHRRLLESRGSLHDLPDFRFEFIPDGLPSLDTDAFQQMDLIWENLMQGRYLASFKRVVSKVSPNIPPVTCVVSDAFMSLLTVTAAEQLRIPIAIFFTFSACGFMGLYQVPVLEERGLLPLKDESLRTNGYSDQVVDFITGMKDMRLRDFFWFDGIEMKFSNDLCRRFCMESVTKVLKAPAVIFHSFDALEPELLNTVSSMFQSVYFIGPLKLQLDQMQHNDLNSIGCNLWKEELECLQWLDSREPNSVLYVNFGSLTVLTKEQLVEFAMGLAKSNHPFLWIIRADLMICDSATLPPEFTEETRDRSFISGWCPQDDVLNHPSISGFLTHCGWGSTIESISAGIPMLCWPFICDQPTNCRYACTAWGVGMEVDNDVKRDELAKLIRELMEGEKGKQMKSRASEWKKLAEEAARPNGSSSLNLDKLINEALFSGK
ncbi:hypothetical protein K2173_014950 [Erythroxylum novogranatense]|uniref:Glycosyltransferase n=1 Tax=Erythroxylum novogranatense TaxID=1862640 RepID=A0AAV8TWV4_9ROSI|nr:hypothetical protein K2173_014950 [Erythroxylum novogranatense]